MVWPSASAFAPSSSCTAARADQAAHQSSQRSQVEVTSWKSTSGTPFATKRGAQCEIAASTLGSFMDLSSPPTLHRDYRELQHPPRKLVGHLVLSAVPLGCF